MRRLTLGIVCVAFACLAFVGWVGPRGQLHAQQPIAPAVKPLVFSDGLIALSSDTTDGRQQVTVIESKTRVMSVYHVDHKTGAIALKSVRDISADLLMDEFNTDSPLPREIRAMQTKR